ncbi:MAG: hypothetical protein R3B72_13800 [Polyangiaceae bacterium]
MASKGRVALLGLVLLAGAIAVGKTPLDRYQRHQRVADALAQTSRCLWGDSLAELDDPAATLRAVAVSASVSGEEAWPARCSPQVGALRERAHELAMALDADCAAGDCDRPLRERLEVLREEARHLAAFASAQDSSALDAERLQGAARRLGLFGASAGSSVPPAPRVAPLLDPKRMQPLYRGDYLRLLTDPAGYLDLDLLFYEDASRYGLCELPIGRGPMTASCRELPPAIPVGLAGELLAAEPGAPRRLYAQGPEGARWSHGLYDVTSGRRIMPVRHRPLGGFVWRDGQVARLVDGPPLSGPSVVRTDGAGEEVAGLLAAPETPSLGPRLIWDEVVWGVPRGGGRHEIFAQPVQPTGEALGAARSLGLTTDLGAQPQLDLCRTDDTLVLLFVGHAHRDGAVASLMFRGSSRGAFAEPLHLKLGAGRFGFTCQEQGATLSWIKGLEEIDAPELAPPIAMGPSEGTPVRGRYGIYRLRCTAEGCDRGRAVVNLSRHHRASRYVAGDLGDRMVVLWRSPLGDVRMRVASLDDMPSAPDVALFDDVEHDGFGWDLERDPIIGRAGAMLVLISRQVEDSEDTATYGFVVDQRGQVAPVEVERRHEQAERLAL